MNFNLDNNGKYVFNIENIMNFIFERNLNRNSDSEITEVYVADDDTKELMLSTKQLREVKGTDFLPTQTVKYDLFKSFLEVLIDMENKGEITTLGEKIVFNTMVNEGLITQVK